MLNTLLERFAFDDVPAAARCNGPSPEPARYRRWRRHSLVAKQSFGSLERSDESRPMILPLTIERPSQIREHLGRSSNPSAHPHRSYRTLRDGAFGARCPRHCVPGYDQAVPPGHLPGALTPPDAHCTAQISYQTVSYTCGTGTLRACVPGVRAGLRSLTPPALFRSPGNFATGSNPSFSTRGVCDPGSRSRTTSWSKGLPHKSDFRNSQNQYSLGSSMWARCLRAVRLIIFWPPKKRNKEKKWDGTARICQASPISVIAVELDGLSLEYVAYLRFR